MAALTASSRSLVPRVTTQPQETAFPRPPPRRFLVTCSKRHRHPGRHQGHQAVALRPNLQDKFSAPLAQSAKEQGTVPGPNAELREKQEEDRQRQEVVASKDDGWVDRAKAQAFWVLRALGTIVD